MPDADFFGNVDVLIRQRLRIDCSYPEGLAPDEFEAELFKALNYEASEVLINDILDEEKLNILEIQNIYNLDG